MNRQIAVLTIIALIQCGMVAALYWPQSRIMDIGGSELLMPFDPDTVDEIYVEDEQGNEAVLLKMSDRWLLPDLAGLPIDPARVDKLLAGISDSAGKWSVATTAASRQRFQVASYRYQRRLTLISAGELLATIYLGTSPGFRRVYARNDDQDAIYSIAYNNYDAPAQTRAWLDLSLLQVEQPLKISGPQYTLLKQEDQWLTEDGEIPDERELAALILALQSIRVDGIADTDMLPTLEIAAPQLSLAIDSVEGATTLALFTVGDQRFIHSDRFDYFFTISAQGFDRLASIYAPALTNTVSADNPFPSH